MEDRAASTTRVPAPRRSLTHQQTLTHGTHGTVVLGIAGGSASGKTTVVSRLVERLGPGRTAVLRHDMYYYDLSHLPFERRAEVNVDHPESLETGLLVKHLLTLRSGGAVEVPRYDFVSQTRARTGTPVRPAPVLLVEGLFALWDGRLRALMDLTAFVDASEDERLERRIERDGRERGRDRAAVLSWHEDRVQPMHERFVGPTRAFADILIPGGGHNEAAIATLARRVLELLESG